MKKTLFTLISFSFLILAFCTLSNNRLQAQCAGNQKMGREFTNGFQTEEECNFEWISQTPCSAIAGATLNDNLVTTWATEYDLSTAPTLFNGTSATGALRQNNNMCMAFAGNPPVHTIYAGPNNLSNLTAYPYPSGMYGNLPQRSRLICPEGWHVPSMCEYWAFQYNVPTTVTYEGWIGLKTVNNNPITASLTDQAHIISSDVSYNMLNGYQTSYVWAIGAVYYISGNPYYTYANAGEFVASPYTNWIDYATANTINNTLKHLNWVCGAN